MKKRRLIDIDKIKPIDFPSTEMDGIDVVRYLNTLPTVDAVEVVHGRWIYEPVEFSIVKDIRCSVCRRYVEVPENYCPDCGAKMDGDGNG